MQTLDFSQNTPQDLIELGSTSLKNIVESDYQPKGIDLPKNDVLPHNWLNDDDIVADVNQHNLNMIRLSQSKVTTRIFGLDTSSIDLGETDNGLLCAVRGTIVWRDCEKYNYTRHGPFVFHITESNKHFLYNKLRQMYFDAKQPAPTPSVWWMPGRIRNVLERWLQRQLSQSCRDSIILWDGSLTAWTIDSPIDLISDVLRTARKRENVVLALSKKTKFRVFGQRVTDLIENRDAPCLLDLDELIRQQYGNYLCFFGRVYAAKFVPSQFTFRLDVDREIPNDAGVEAVQRLIGNDLVADSYPETLRIAHILSRFSASEVIGMQRFISENFGIKIVTRPNLRQILFGPYGGGASNNRAGIS